MAELYNYNKGTVITNVVTTCLDSQEVNRITNKALDGSTYLQIIGQPSKTISVVCAVQWSGREALMEAEREGDLLRVTMSYGTYYGRIVDCQIGSKLPQDWFQAQLSLLEEEV